MARDTVAWTTVLASRATYRVLVRPSPSELPRRRAENRMTESRGASALQLEPSEQVLDRSVTLARALLESPAIENVHAAVRIADDAFLLQGAGHHVHGLAGGGEHHREKLLAELKFLASHAVVRHQEPSAAARFHPMEGKTCSGLHHQAHQSLTVALDTLPKGARLLRPRSGC